MSKCCRLLWISVAFLFLFSGFAVSAQSVLPYDGYIYNTWNESVPSPNGYLSVASYTGEQLGVGGLKAASDMFIDEENHIFIADTGNQRIIELDSDFQSIRVIDKILVNGEPQNLVSPAGLFVDGDHNIYFTEKDNNRVVKVNSEGELLQVFTRPETNLLTDDFIFLPYKVLVNQTGVVFVLSENFSYGAISYSAEGEFLGFWGSNTVEMTVDVLVDRIFKTFLTQDQKNKMERYVPIQYTGFDIDQDNFIYTCTQNTNVTKEQIKKLNALGTNVLPDGDKLVFGDLETGYYMAQLVKSTFSDVCIAENGLINALDYTSGRVFQYDQEGRLLTIFGGLGGQQGLFQMPIAVECLDDRILVLDQSKQSLTVFRPTEYMELIHSAVGLYNEGNYQEAKQLWEQVLRHNQNFEFAYTGIGKACYEQGNYQKAMAYFKLGNDREEYSSAFREYRAGIVRQFSIAIPILAVLSVPAIVLLRLWSKKRKKRPAPETNTVREIAKTMVSPIGQFEEFKYHKQWSPIACTVILFAWYFCTVLLRQTTGFIFNNNDLSKLNLLLVFAFTIIAFFLFVVVNWAVTSLLDGKGTLKEIAISGSYALIPYVVSQLLYVLLSQILILEEQSFLSIIQLIGVLWSAFLLLSALKSIHEYSVKKTIASAVLTIIGVALVLFLAVLMYGLVQQFLSFFNSIYHELMLR